MDYDAPPMGPTMRQTVPFLFDLFGGNFLIRGFQTLEAKLPVRVKVEAASLSLRCPANLASATKNCPACRTNPKKLSYKKSMNMQRLIILDSCSSSDTLPEICEKSKQVFSLSVQLTSGTLTWDHVALGFFQLEHTFGINSMHAN